MRAFVDVAAGGRARRRGRAFGVGAADYVEGFGGKRGRPFAAEALNSPFKLNDHPDVAYVLGRAHRAAFRWVYAVECDVGFSGNFSAFVGAHGAASEDLLAFHVGWRPVGWPFSARMAPRRRALVGGPDGWAAWYGAARARSDARSGCSTRRTDGSCSGASVPRRARARASRAVGARARADACSASARPLREPARARARALPRCVSRYLRAHPAVGVQRRDGARSATSPPARRARRSGRADDAVRDLRRARRAAARPRLPPRQAALGARVKQLGARSEAAAPDGARARARARGAQRGAAGGGGARPRAVEDLTAHARAARDGCAVPRREPAAARRARPVVVPDRLPARGAARVRRRARRRRRAVPVGLPERDARGPRRRGRGVRRALRAHRRRRVPGRALLARAREPVRAGGAGCAAPRAPTRSRSACGTLAGASDAARAGDEASEPRARLAARLAAFKRRRARRRGPGLGAARKGGPPAPPWPRAPTSGGPRASPGARQARGPPTPKQRN